MFSLITGVVLGVFIERALVKYTAHIKETKDAEDTVKSIKFDGKKED